MSGEPELVWVYVTNSVRTSAGAGIGPAQVPPDEARALVADHHAKYGAEPPRDWSTFATENARLHAPRRNA